MLAACKNRQRARLYRADTIIDFAKNRRPQGGPVDHRVATLIARSTAKEEERPIAVLFNYACHNTCLGGEWNKVSGDWSGYASEALERDIEGVVALSLIGCGADANPNPRGTLDLARKYGELIAAMVRTESWPSNQPLSHSLTCRLTHGDLPWQTPPTKEEFEKRSAEPSIVGHHAKYFLKKLAAGEKIDTPLKYPVATWAFGDDLVVFLAGEVVVDYSIALHERCQGEKLWITAYANDVPCYIPSQRILREGGYEAESSLLYYGRPARLSPDVEEIILDAVQKLLPPEFHLRLLPEYNIAKHIRAEIAS